MGHFYYFSTDHDNAVAAGNMGLSYGLNIEHAEPRDLPKLESRQCGVIMDWDFVPADYRARLLNGSPAKVVAVHGYQIPDSVGSLLAERRNIIVSRKLNNEFVRAVAGNADDD